MGESSNKELGSARLLAPPLLTSGGRGGGEITSKISSSHLYYGLFISTHILTMLTHSFLYIMGYI